MQTLVRDFFYCTDCAEKKLVFSAHGGQEKHLHMRSKLFEPHSQPVLNGAQCLKSHGITIDPLGTGP